MQIHLSNNIKYFLIASVPLVIVGIHYVLRLYGIMP